MTATTIASIIVAVIAAVSAYASQKAASRATTMNTYTTSRVDMEREAYERARAFDTETIRRQDEEIKELRERIKDLEKNVSDIRSSKDARILELENEVDRIRRNQNGGTSQAGS